MTTTDTEVPKNLVNLTENYGFYWAEVSDFTPPNRIRIEAIVPLDKEQLAHDFKERYEIDPTFNNEVAAEELEGRIQDQIDTSPQNYSGSLIADLRSKGWEVDLHLHAPPAATILKYFEILKENMR